MPARTTPGTAVVDLDEYRLAGGAPWPRPSAGYPDPMCPKTRWIPIPQRSSAWPRLSPSTSPRIEMTGNGRNGRFRVGAGSAVLFTDRRISADERPRGGRRQAGHAVFADGTRTAVDIVGRRPAVRSCRGPRQGSRPRHRLNSATPRPSGSANWSLPSAIRSGSAGFRHGRGGQRAGPVHSRSGPDGTGA